MMILLLFYPGKENCIMSNKAILNKIKFEIKQVDKLLNNYEDLIRKCKEKEPELVELTALASVLHSFYNGIENIFSLIAKGVDESKPKGSNWHKELLIQMTESKDSREAIISEELKDEIKDYLGFRHFYRHSYSFYLDWNEMKELILSIFDTWNKIKENLNNFVENSFVENSNEK